MGKSAILSVRVVGDAKEAQKALADTGTAVTDLGNKSKDVSGKIESIGDTAGRATTGLRDMSDAIALAGFPEFAAGMSLAATGLEAVDGAANLYRASSEALNGVIGKLTGTNKAATAATTAGSAATKRSTASSIAHKAATIAQSAATKAMTIAQRALNLVMKMNPIGLIVTAIAALVAGLVTAYQKSETFRNIVDTLWRILKNSLVKAFEAVAGAISTVVGWLKDAWEWIKKVIDNIKNIKLPDWLPGDQGKSLGLWVAPAGAAPRTVPAPAASGITININSPVGDPHALARELRRLLRADAARLGRPGGRDIAVSA